TEAGTIRVKDIVSGIGSSNPQNLTNVNGILYFSASDSSGGKELWKSDGTEDGTVRVKDIFSGTGSSKPQNLTNVNGTL
ncbi:MAG: ELWxxDGT repeat protein, partial [Nostoc sp. DedQUE01]|nr:peptidase [Nostoc sp. DedQUE01]